MSRASRRAEPVARGDEDRGLAGERRDRAILRRGGLEKPQTGRADGDNAAAGLPRGIQRSGGLRVDPAPFRVHAMIVRVLRLHRQKGAGPDVQRNPHDGDAARRNGGGKRRREVQAGSRCRDGAGMAREHRLVIVPIGFVDRAFAGDVRRERRGAVTLQRRIQVSVGAREPQHHLAFAHMLDANRLEHIWLAGELDDLSDSHLLRRLEEGAPKARSAALVQRGLDAGG